MLKTSVNQQENTISSKTELKEFFLSGCKSCAQKFTGLEFEKLPVNQKTFKAATYQEVASFLKEFQKHDLQKIEEKSALLGLKNSDGTITLEPGSQTELSLNPTSDINKIHKYLTIYNQTTSRLAQKHGIHWLGCGIQPVSTYRNINIIPKKRYEFMTKYLPTVAKKPLVMMRETAGIQSSFDYESEEDAMRKLSTALKLSPIISAVYSNSPIRNGRLSKLKSNRSASWLETDNNRCGLISTKAFHPEEFSFDEYVEILLDVPMIFIERKDSQNAKTAVKVENITFRNFLKEGYQGFQAQKEDWLLHLSLYFPDVRFKNYIEIRNHDNQRSEVICSVPAFWKGLMYNKDALCAVNELLEKFSYFDFEYLRRKTPQKGLNIKIKHYPLHEIAYEVQKISYDSLKSFERGEEQYLEPIMELTQQGLTPADLVIDKWENEWRGDLAKFAEYSRLK